MTVSLLGDGVYLVAIAWLALRLSNAPTALSSVGVAWTLPQVVFLLWGGVISDRVDRRLVMIASDVVRAGAIALIGVLALAGTVELWHLYILVGIYGVAEGFFLPAFTSIVPDVVPQSLLMQANSVDQFVRPVVWRFAGPAIGGLVIAGFGVGPAFLFDAATFAISGAAIALMHPRPRKKRAPSVRAGIREMREGFAYVRREAWLWISFVAAALGLLAFFGPFQVLLPFIIKNHPFDGGARDLGFVLALGGMGAVLAAIIMSQRQLPRRHVTFAYVMWAAGTLAIAGYALATHLWELMIFTFLMEAFTTAGMIVWASLLQSKVPNNLLGRVSSVDWLVSSSLIPLSLGITGPISNHFGARTTLLGAGFLGAAAILSFLAVPRLHDIESPRT